jgi:hypothetical protein
MLINVGRRGRSQTDFYERFVYGVEFDTAVANSACVRIGASILHQTLPIHSKIKRCLLSDSGIATYLDASDTTKLASGAAADLSGASGMVMVETPAHWRKFETQGTKVRCLISEIEQPGFHYVPRYYRSAYEATVERATNKLSSVVNTTAAYRGGNNDASGDALSRTLLGRPASQLSLTNFRAYARNRGSNKWNCDVYDVQKAWYWLYLVEYANFNSQLAYNAAPTAAGYRQGGLGDGVTNIDSTKWTNFNAYYPFIPCGYTNSLGNRTGTIAYTMPFEYDSSGAVNYKGEYNPATAYLVGNFVSSGNLLYRCILDSTGNALSNTTYFAPVTRTITYVPSYRGLENPFGHIWSWTDGCKCKIQSDVAGGVSSFFVSSDPANFQDTNYNNYTQRGVLPRTSNYIKQLIVSDNGENMPLVVGGSSVTYMSDYFYTSVPATSEEQRGVLFGGIATYGAVAGLGCSSTYYATSYSAAFLGARLCFLPGA